MRLRNSSRTGLAVVLLASLLAACGGGGGSATPFIAPSPQGANGTVAVSPTTDTTAVLATVNGLTPSVTVPAGSSGSGFSLTAAAVATPPPAVSGGFTAAGVSKAATYVTLAASGGPANLSSDLTVSVPASDVSSGQTLEAVFIPDGATGTPAVRKSASGRRAQTSTGSEFIIPGVIEGGKITFSLPFGAYTGTIAFSPIFPPPGMPASDCFAASSSVQTCLTTTIGNGAFKLGVALTFLNATQTTQPFNNARAACQIGSISIVPNPPSAAEAAGNLTYTTTITGVPAQDSHGDTLLHCDAYFSIGPPPASTGLPAGWSSPDYVVNFHLNGTAAGTPPPTTAPTATPMVSPSASPTAAPTATPTPTPTVTPTPTPTTAPTTAPTSTPGTAPTPQASKVTSNFTFNTTFNDISTSGGQVPIPSIGFTSADFSLPGVQSAATGTLTVSVGNSDFAPSVFEATPSGTPLEYIEVALSAPFTFVASVPSGPTVDLCFPTGSITSPMYFFNYVANGSSFGSVSATIGTNDATCPTSTHLSAPVTPLASMPASSTAFGIEIMSP